MYERLERSLRSYIARAGLRGVPVPALVALALAVVVMVGAALWRWWPQDAGAVPAQDSKQATTNVATSTAGGSIAVHVVGAIRTPGLYRLSAGSRVDDAVEAAGGALGSARLDLVNLARIVSDGEQVMVPSIDDVADQASPQNPVSGGSGSSGTAGVIDLNRADEAALDTLPGVGPATAARIVADREENGPFASVEDLARVSGIGPKKIEQLADLACVR